MGIKIMTDERSVKVHRYDNNGKPSYAIRIAKQEGDSWVGSFQKIRFRTGVEVHDKQNIYIKSAFPTVESWVKDEKQYTRIVWQIMEFDSDTPYTEPQESVPEVGAFSQADDDIPF